MPPAAPATKSSLAIEDAAAAALEAARAAGADAADTVVSLGDSLSAQVRRGAVETIERSEERDLGLRVFVGRSSAIVSSNDFSLDAVTALAARAVAIARAAPEDPNAGLAEPSQIATTIPDLDLSDGGAPDADHLADLALAAEEASQEVSGVTNSLGASASAGASRFVLAATNGFEGNFATTRYSLSCTAVSGSGTAMQRDYDYAMARYLADLDEPAAIGRKAGERAVARVGARKIATGRVDVVYEPRMAASLLGHLTNAIDGRTIARGASFLKDAMGSQVFAPGIVISDDPHVVRGLRSRPFDGEGLAGTPRDLVSDGHLTTWLLDLSAARQLGLESTGHATRGASSNPSPAPSNLVLRPGTSTPEDLISGISHGLLVTGLIGMGVNGVTGDYSRGAEGFAIENGEIAGPVAEVTIAAALPEMFARMVPANDLEIRTGRDAPTVLIEGMTLAGS